MINDKNTDSINSLDKSLQTKCMMNLMIAFINASSVNYAFRLGSVISSILRINTHVQLNIRERNKKFFI